MILPVWYGALSAIPFDRAVAVDPTVAECVQAGGGELDLSLCLPTSLGQWWSAHNREMGGRLTLAGKWESYVSQRIDPFAVLWRLQGRILTCSGPSGRGGYCHSVTVGHWLWKRTGAPVLDWQSYSPGELSDEYCQQMMQGV